MKNILYSLFIFITFALPVNADKNTSGAAKVSLINIIADPSKYSNREIEVCGYFYYEEGIEGGNYIFLTREYARIHDMANSISLPKKVGSVDGKRPPSGTYVRVVGVLGDYDDKLNFTKEIYMKSVLRITAYVLDKEQPKSGVVHTHPQAEGKPTASSPAP